VRYLVTGGAGFIGSHLTEALLRRGDEVIVVDDLSTGDRANLAGIEAHPGIRLVIGSCGDARIMAEPARACDGIFHLASVVGVRRVLASPIRTLTDNIGATETVLALASEHRKPVLIASSSEVYGRSRSMPLREDTDLSIGLPEKDRWSYACSKAACEFLAGAYFREKRVPVVIVRLFNTVGPRQTGRYGMVIPTFVSQALAGQPITVFGDGRQSRSFGYVGDIVSGLIALAGEPKAVGDVFNLGNPEEISMLDLAHRVKALTGSASPITLIPYDEAYEAGFEDMPRRVPDITKAHTLVGFTPAVPLDEILRRVIAHARAGRSL